MKYVTYIFTVFVLITPVIAHAHSGRTDSSGGHNCRTGACAGSYHYHNGGSASRAVQAYTPPASTYTEFDYNKLVDQKDELNALVLKQETEIASLTEKSNELESFVEKNDKLEEWKDTLLAENESFKRGDALNSLKAEVKQVMLEKKNLEVAVSLAEEEALTSDDNGLFNFLLGAGALYGVQRVRGRKERKNEGVLIKGNITEDGEKVYYTVDSRYYSMVRLDIKKGEKWFKDEDEAIAAGWKKA